VWIVSLGKVHFVRCTDGYSTNVPLTIAIQTAMLLANKHDGQCLTLDHVGPVRVVLPSLYGWKGAKLVKSIEILDRDKSGYRESRGYHSRGDPWKGGEILGKYWLEV